MKMKGLIEFVKKNGLLIALSIGAVVNEIATNKRNDELEAKIDSLNNKLPDKEEEEQ